MTDEQTHLGQVLCCLELSFYTIWCHKFFNEFYGFPGCVSPKIVRARILVGPKTKKNSDLQILSCRTAIYGMFAVVILTELYAFWTTREGYKIDGSVERSFLMQLLEVIFFFAIELKKVFY